MPVKSLPDANEPIEFLSRNPKRDGTKAYMRYERYKVAKSVTEALALGAAFGDIKHDFEKGFLKKGVGTDDDEDDVVVVAEPIIIDPPATGADSGNQAEQIVIDPPATSAGSSNQAEPIIIDPPATSADSSNQAGATTPDMSKSAELTTSSVQATIAKAEEARQAAEEAAQKAAQGEEAQQAAEEAARRVAEESTGEEAQQAAEAKEAQQAAEEGGRKVAEEGAAKEVKKKPARTLSSESVCSESTEQSQHTPARTLSSESVQSESAERCMICLTACRCAHIAVHGKGDSRCGPYPICVTCSRRVVETSEAHGQFKCPICKRRLGSLRRAMTEGALISLEAVSTPSRRRKQTTARDVHGHSASAAASAQGADSASGSSKKARTTQDLDGGCGTAGFQLRPDIRPLIWEFPELGSSD